MTTQREVAAAFVRGESAPNVASNYRRLRSEDGSIEYLCGGYDGRELVLAKKEPIDHFTVYPNPGFADARMRYGTCRRQARTTRRVIHHLVGEIHDDVERYVDVIRSDNSPTVDSIDDIQ